jgi:hypothetical protein
MPLDSRGITTFGTCAPPNDDPNTIEYLTYRDGAWPRICDAPVPRRPVPISVGGHLGDDSQESGGLAR